MTVKLKEAFFVYGKSDVLLLNAISEINAAGGISIAGKKMKIEVIERDDEGKNDRGALVAQELTVFR